MSIAIVIPSNAFRTSAGAVIRYQRMIEAAPPDAFTLVPLDELTDRHSGFLISKAYHPQMPALAAHLAAKRKPVVLDVFDDYFTMRDNARFAAHARWFDGVSAAAHAVTVSTPTLAERLAPLTQHKPVVVPDPAETIDLAAIKASLEQRSPPDPAALHFGWFGIASNPYFPAGLADLSAFAPVLAALPGRHRLTVVTNLDGASDEALAALARAPLRTSLTPWSPQAQRDLLQSVDAVLLPVNAQPFSAAKSLNRAVTALIAGAQVITHGAPIYSALAPHIYNNPVDFAADATRGQLRHRGEHLPSLAARLETLAGPAASAEAMLGVFNALKPRVRPPVASLLARTPALNAPAAADMLTIAAPFSTAPDGADITLGTTIGFSPRAISRLPWRTRRRLKSGTVTARRLGLRAPTPGRPHNPMRAYLRLSRSLPAALALCHALLPDHDILVADDEVLP